MEKMMPIVNQLAESYAYRRLEALIGFFEEGIFIPLLARKIKLAFLVLKRKIMHVIRMLSKTDSPDASKMYFYRLVRKFLPAYPKFYDLNII